VSAQTFTAYCILGSNLGDRETLLRRATFALAASQQIELVRGSSLYESPAWGRTDQPAYLNAAVELKTSLSPEVLLVRFKEIEAFLGRDFQAERWTARAIDLDLALYEDRIIQTENLIVPHLDLANRAFALLPLLEIAPDACDPASKKPYTENLATLGVWGAGKFFFDLNEGGHIDVLWPLLHSHSDAFDTNFSTVLFQSEQPEETEQIAATLGLHLQGGEVIALSGNLGAGKTCFARGLARGLQIPGPITSPSYVLVKSYEGRLVMHHADFYRLTGDDQDAGAEPPDLASLGLDDYLEDPNAVVLIEWAERYPNFLEPPFWLVEIEGSGDRPRFLLVRRIR
jgi:2-amino-4-hydroxy-6-hydroxymethyldihydropteridine diphosphokinase